MPRHVLQCNITSGISVLVGSRTFDPRLEEDLAEKMEQWLRNPDDAQRHAEKGRERALKEHSMEAYAEKLLAIYDLVLSHRL